MSVGSAAATGISAGFQMGREITNDQDRRAQVARENARQDTLDQQRTDQITRVNQRQDVQDADTEQDRGLAAVNSEMEDNRIQLAGLAQHYGGVDKIPQSVVTPLITQAQDISQRRVIAAESRSTSRSCRKSSSGLPTRRRASRPVSYRWTT